MKKIYTLALASLLLSSCNLDFEPTSGVSDGTLTDGDYQYLLTGVYDAAQSTSIIIDDIAADNLNCPSWIDGIDANALTSDNSSVNGWWSSYYEGVQLANNLINLLGQKGELSDTETAYVAEARVIRAWFYVRIINFWGDAPYVHELGDNILPRVPAIELWQHVVDDLEYGVAHAPEFSNAGHVSVQAAKALLARVLLIAPEGVSDLPRAARLAEELIADPNFALADDYADIWHAKTSKEMILQWTNISGDSGAPGWWLRSDLVNLYEAENGAGSAGYGELGRYEYPLDMALYNAYEADDVQRKSATVRHLKLAGGAESYDCVKYPSYDAADNTPVARIAEMYLISAEAQGYPAGVGRLNELRAKRGLHQLVSGTEITADNFIERIMKERRVELAVEGHRWYDLQRWWRMGDKGKAAVLALNCYQPSETAGSRPGASDNMNIAQDGYNLLFPVPSVAIDNNSLLLPNNPGY